MDFLPYCISSGGLFSTPTFEPFRVLLQRANDWLKENCTWEVKTCESVEFKTSSEVVNTERMTYYEYGEQSTRYVRSLRLWLVPRLDQSRPAQQLEYRNLIPQQTGHAGLFGMPTFETLHELLERYNQQLMHQPAPGRVLAVETQEMKIPSYSNFDPDRSYWSEYGGRNRHFLFVVRVFYELGSTSCEEIGEFHRGCVIRAVFRACVKSCELLVILYGGICVGQTSRSNILECPLKNTLFSNEILGVV